MNIGDTVRLKSGGPIMTVTQVEPSFLGCSWHTGGEHRYACYPEAALEPAAAPKPAHVLRGEPGVLGNVVDSALAAELQEKMRKEAERAFGAGLKPILLPTEQRIRKLEMELAAANDALVDELRAAKAGLADANDRLGVTKAELADANDKLRAHRAQIEHLEALRSATYRAGVNFTQRDSGEWDAVLPAYDGTLVRELEAKLAELRECLAAAVSQRDQWMRQCNLTSEARAEALNDAASERSRNVELETRRCTLEHANSQLRGQVEAAGRIGVHWTWEGGVCKAHVKDDGLRDQLARLTDFHNKVCALLR